MKIKTHLSGVIFVLVLFSSFTATEAATVSGSGKVTSPVGSCPSTPAADATFTITQLYAKHDAAGTLNSLSNTFKFSHAGCKLTFNSVKLTSMVIVGNRVDIRGYGYANLNGVTIKADFLFSGLNSNSAGTTDFIRVKLTSQADGSVIYDNQQGSPDEAPPVQPATTGPGTFSIRA